MADIETGLMTEVLKEIRNQLRDQGQLLSKLVELTSAQSRRMERMDAHISAVDARFAEQTDELMTIAKDEMLGVRTNFEIQWEDKLHDLDERIRKLEENIGA